MKTSDGHWNISVHFLMKSLRLLLALYLVVNAPAFAQEKHSVQIKTFDQQLAPYPHLEISINDKNYVAISAKGIGFTELSDSDLPIKTIHIKNEQMEAASWNYSKGTLEVIIRKKNYQIARVLVKDENNTALAHLKLTFKGRKTLAVTTDAEGRFELPLALDERIIAPNQFSADEFTMSRLNSSGTENILIANRINPIGTAETVANRPVAPRTFFKDFDLSKLDSIQSLTVFYAIFKNYDRKKLTKVELQRVDDKFNELVSKLEGAAQNQQPERQSFIGRISDTTFIAEDIRNLLQQARQESQTLTDQRTEFDEKLKIINDKLAQGLSNLDEPTRKKLLSDLELLERILNENESRFYKNQNDYRELINAIKDKYFNFEDLEHKLTASELQRLEEQRVFRQRLILISSIVLLFAILIILLIRFSIALRKQKKELELANAEIRRINENLEALVFQRTQLLEAANKELDTFLYRASHDMRTPVRAIMGLCNIAGMLTQGEPKELVDRISHTTTSMDKLLKKLSIISEINQPSNFSSVTLMKVIRQLEHSFGKTIQENNVEFVVDCPADLTISSYPNLIETILSNVTENALYYGSVKNGMHRVQISVSLKDDTAIIQVFDNGIGIDASLQDRIFDMFFKGTEFSRGNGLGLYIVQKAVQALEGKVSVESELKEYTRFTIVLPLKIKTLKKKEKLVLAETA
jgi:signal transduction histidine kinase